MINSRKTFYLLPFIYIFLLLLGCNTPSKTATDTKIVTPKKLTPEEYIANRLDFKTFNGKASLSIRTKDENQNVGANIKMKKEEFIWSSVVALGGLLEVARAYITPDSLKALVRIGKTSYSLSYEEGLALLKADIEFSVFQNLIVGNPLMTDGKITDSKAEDGMMVITMKKDGYSQQLSYDLETHLLKRLQLNAPEKNFKCAIEYANYQPLALKEPFSYSRNIQIENNGEKISINMNFDRAELNIPVEVNFSIPSSYTPGKL